MVEVIWSVRSCNVMVNGDRRGRRYQAVAYRRHFRRADDFPVWRRDHALKTGPVRKTKEAAAEDAKERGPVDLAVEQNFPAIWPEEILTTGELEAAWRLGALSLCVVTGSMLAAPRDGRYRVAPLSQYQTGVAFLETGPGPTARWRMLRTLGAFTHPQVERLARLLFAQKGRVERLSPPGEVCFPVLSPGPLP